ncbi:MAG TPA: hypothetical protein EYQ81_01505 [Sneathiellales bacterium]|nr:hypothetical protein [Sneathiellales bacterium]
MNTLQTYGALALKGGLALLVLIILPLALALEFVPERGVIGALSVERLVVRLQDRGVNFDFSAGNLAPIPRVFTAHIPADWRFLKPPARQKKYFSR